MHMRMSIRAATAAAMLCVTRVVVAQTATEYVAMGDREYNAMNLAAALKHYEAGIAADSTNVEAIWKASNAAIDLGEFNDAERQRYYEMGEQLARLAVKVNPRSADAHFALAKALGRAALSKGKREKVKFASAVHDEAHAALQLDSLHAGALHVLGMWHAEIMRLSGFERFMAKNLLGGRVLGEASWDNAQRYLERAVTLEPNRITHHRDLAGVYADRSNSVKAREEYETVLRLPATEYNDPAYKRQAEQRLKELPSSAN
jgi:tetratricopeptide (TPR) repeat protein